MKQETIRLTGSKLSGLSVDLPDWVAQEIPGLEVSAQMGLEDGHGVDTYYVKPWDLVHSLRSKHTTAGAWLEKFKSAHPMVFIFHKGTDCEVLDTVPA